MRLLEHHLNACEWMFYIRFSPFQNQNQNQSWSFTNHLLISSPRTNDVRMGNTASMPPLIIQYSAVAVWSWWRPDWWRIFAAYGATQWTMMSMTSLRDERGTLASDLHFHMHVRLWLNTSNRAPQMVPIQVPSAVCSNIFSRTICSHG